MVTGAQRGRSGPAAAPPPDTVVSLLRARAREQPEREQYRFLDPDGGSTATVAEVLSGARTVARGLGGALRPGDRVVLLLPAGRLFVLGFFGALEAGSVPVPVAVPGRSRLTQALRPLRAVADDCAPAAVLTTAAVHRLVHDALDADDPLLGRQWIRIEDLSADRAGGPAPADRAPAPDDVAYLQYTSGSTAEPKGVVVTHGAVVANLRTIHDAFGNRPEDRGMIWLPPHHDMGLIGGVLAPLWSAMTVALAPAPQYLQAPARWLRWISDTGATVSGGPDFAYRLCVERARDDQLTGVDLSRWRVAFTGAEPISARTLDAFADRFGPWGFRSTAFHPCYGLAEATLMVTGGDAEAEPVVRTVSRRALEDRSVAEPAGDGDDSRSLVGCGRPVGRCDEVLVVDPEDRIVRSPGEVGEIWYRGPSAGAGYHGDAVRSAAAFAATTADGRGPFLRTGDLGFLDDDGNLFVTGRRKDVVVVQGRNLDAHDLESVVAGALGGLRAGMTAAVSDVRSEAERLVILQEIGRSDARKGAEIRKAVQGGLSHTFGIRADEVVLLSMGTLPRTTSGKVRRAEAVRRLGADELEPLVHDDEEREPCASSS